MTTPRRSKLPLFVPQRLFGVFTLAATLGVGGVPAAGIAGTTPEYMPDIPPGITTPETVDTRIGTLHFPNGVPDEETAQKVYDQLDFGRGVDAFLRGMSATSVQAICTGMEDAGIETNKGLGITADLMNARQLFLTANTTTVYVAQCLDLSDGPIVLRVPPKILGMVDDADFRWVTDIGFTSPDKGAGGDFLFVPPGYDGEVPSEGYYVRGRAPTGCSSFIAPSSRRATSPLPWNT